jgi:thiazole synthase
MMLFCLIYSIRISLATARNAKERFCSPNPAREVLENELVKLEIHPDPRYLMPDAIET